MKRTTMIGGMAMSLAPAALPEKSGHVMTRPDVGKFAEFVRYAVSETPV